MLYSYKGRYPENIPSRIRLPDGTTRTDPTSFTKELLETCGYIEVSDKPKPSSENHIVEWSGSSWVERPLTQEELDDIRSGKILLIKQEASRRILEVYPDWRQANMTARAVELQDIWRINQAWTTEEQQEADNLKLSWAWIKNIREKSNILEAMDLIPEDYTNDIYWS